MLRRRFDRRAILAGALAQAPLFPVFRIALGELGVHLLVGPLVSGAVAGVLSRTYQDEFIDGALAGLFGLLVAVYVDVLILTHLADASGKVVFASTSRLLAAVLVVGTTLALFGGALSGHVAARARREWGSSPLEE